MTVNKSGPANRLPLKPWTSCAVTSLVDDMIKDKWIAPEDRFQEIAQIYKGQTQTLTRTVTRLENKIRGLLGEPLDAPPEAVWTPDEGWTPWAKEPNATEDQEKTK